MTCQPVKVQLQIFHHLLNHTCKDFSNIKTGPKSLCREFNYISQPVQSLAKANHPVESAAPLN